MKRFGVTAVADPSSRRSFARANAGAALFPVYPAAGSVGADPAVIAIVVAILLLATGGVVLLRMRSDDQSVGTDTAQDHHYSAPEADAESDPGDDRDRIREIIAGHGGRTRQTVIVEETGWSKAKVSSVLAEMDEAGEVSKLRVGRENIVSLPGHEPDAVDSPLED